LVKGFIGTTLLDFPGKIAAAIFTGGCNFQCPYCHNPGIVKGDDLKQTTFIPLEQIIEELIRRKGFIDGVVISGGEPLLHKDLPDFIKQINQLQLDIKLDTNGYCPDSLRALLDGDLIRYTAMDVKTSTEKYSWAAGIKVNYSLIQASINLIKESSIDYEFRTTVVPGIVEKEDILCILKSIKGAKTYVLQQFVPHHTLNPAYRKVRPYPMDKLEYFAKLAENYVNNVFIRDSLN